MQQDLGNYLLKGIYSTIEFRGSNSAPDTTVNNILPLNFYDANNSNDGWGATVPSSWGSNQNFRYLQIKITL
jgi:hypothetical protein